MPCYAYRRRPGKQEDLQGLPFVGAAGKLLDLLLSALMFKEEDYYVPIL